jgi:predicted regulator of amino acid metabolism with ACT domain
MDFKSLKERAQELTGSASDAVSKMLDEFNAALPTMRALGFNVADLKITAGLLPEVSAKLTASASDVDEKALDDLIQEKADQKTLVAVLKGLKTAYNVRDQLGDLGLNGVEVDVTLGLPPSIRIGFLKSPSASASAPANSGA